MVRVVSVKRRVEPIRIRIGEQIVVELDGDAGEEQLSRVLNAASGLRC